MKKHGEELHKNIKLNSRVTLEVREHVITAVKNCCDFFVRKNQNSQSWDTSSPLTQGTQNQSAARICIMCHMNQRSYWSKYKPYSEMYRRKKLEDPGAVAFS